MHQQSQDVIARHAHLLEAIRIDHMFGSLWSSGVKLTCLFHFPLKHSKSPLRPSKEFRVLASGPGIVRYGIKGQNQCLPGQLSICMYTADANGLCLISLPASVQWFSSARVWRALQTEYGLKSSMPEARKPP